MHALIRFRRLGLLLLAAVSLGLRAASKEAWVEVRSAHFVAYSDAGEAEARRALKGFEGIRSVFQGIFPGIRVDPPKPMIILVVEDQASMKRLLPREFEGRDPKSPSGIFASGPDRNYALLRLDVDQQADQPYFVLFHEYTHSIVHQNFPALPTWLDEGLADFYGATEIQSDRVLLGRVPTGRLARLRQGDALPLETLLQVTQASPHYREGEKTGMFYAQSWAFVHFLLMDEKARKAGLFQAFLKAHAESTGALAAAREGFGDLASLQTTLNQYARRSSFAFLNLPLAVELTDKDFQSRSLDHAEALVVRAEFLQHTRQPEAAELLLAEASRTAPRLPGLHTALAQGHLLRGELEQARAAFELALHLGSRDFRVPYQLARLAQDRLGSGPSDSTQILVWLEAVRALRPDFPGLHMALCRQYTWEPRDSARALQAGRAAVELEPQNLALRANLGLACMSLELEKEAMAIGEQLRTMAFTEEERRMAGSYAQDLERFRERLRARAAEAALRASRPEHEKGTSSTVGPVAPVKFSLPSHLAALGQEVIQLVSRGKTPEAIRKVEQALATSKYDYDRKALRALLRTLRKSAPPK